MGYVTFNETSVVGVLIAECPTGFMAAEWALHGVPPVINGVQMNAKAMDLSKSATRS